MPGRTALSADSDMQFESSPLQMRSILKAYPINHVVLKSGERFSEIMNYHLAVI